MQNQDRESKRLYALLWRKKNPERVKGYKRTFDFRQRKKVLSYYSGNSPKCACCGENEYKFLTVDHINNDGAKYRKEINGDLEGWIIKHNFPKIFQILCWNCNMSKGHYGICPHSVRK